MHYILTDLEGNRKLVKGHHIVAQAFLGYDPSQYDRKNIESLVVDHQNGLRWDNRLENLRIMTQDENIHAHYTPHKKVLALSLDENLIAALKERAKKTGKHRYLSRICEKILKAGLDKNGNSKGK